uniref:Transglutaminase-like domain-containing protein n=1 Tax=Anolis carolinensis TaxID=28377 RepID=A0A803U1Q3_ANOCA|nr:PREDICTED: protein-glutamine gamma-glutamyltransferase 4 isoform X2 [Anolis carolinensis]|eukprot:XP_008113745.1 PREDICTED: protein-glutamine gamma-glutamyltransferase 4 isoform X2 [Anolis carolinensis]
MLRILQSKGKEHLITVVSPADAIIGKYILDIETRPESCSPGRNFFYVLFNPWCKDDSTFLPGDAQKNEYVLNHIGTLYTLANVPGSEWTYGQFEEGILDCCLYLLDKSKLVAKERRDPVKITRAMSALVNKEDDEGVLEGKWKLKKSCDGHTCPHSWKGSVPILNEYYKTKKPVKYAQCWVFSGVLTTILRCLGIPTRSVTTYDAGVDKDGNLKIEHPDDTVWNFHVWNDVWMKRPDLPDGHDGWQAVDGTNQKPSLGIYRCGPASLKAIKKGEIDLDYDTRFLFAAVNAEYTVKIGTRIITRSLCEGKPFENIMDDYKFPEGSIERTKALELAKSLPIPKNDLAQTYGQSHLEELNQTK